MTAAVYARTVALLDEAVAAYGTRPGADRLQAARDRMDEPLRVAIAGKIKAGKSTLLNALVGEQLAPTDAGECTRIVTWYRDGHTPRVTAHPVDGQPEQLRFTRDASAILISLGDFQATELRDLTVEWPSASLSQHTLVDTPGIDSLSAEVSDRAHAFLTPADEHDTPADAVLYLMRHLHASDVDFLEAFHDDDVAQATPINAIAVLSRADEIGVGRIDAMDTATRIAARYRADEKVRRLCQTVVPLAGLLAESACTLRQDEFRAFQLLADASAEETDRLLLSADRFRSLATEVSLDAEQRHALLQRFGIFGIRLAVALVRSGLAGTAPRLADELRRRSGLDELRQTLTAQFGARRETLKARAGLTALQAVFRETPLPENLHLEVELERIVASAHEFAELRLLNAMRSGGVTLPEAERVERLLGVAGVGPAARLGLREDAPGEDIRHAAIDELTQWRRHAENPLTDRTSREAAGVLVRTCEGLLMGIELAPSDGVHHDASWR